MSLFFSDYLFPANPIALGVITFLIGFFSVWLIGLIRYWRWLGAERKHIENNQNIQLLVTAQHEQDRGSEGDDQKANPENAFSEFCQESSLDRRSPIAKHLKAIFFAGWNESRLEVSELITHTTSDLFKWNSFFRSMLAVFIVIGLLGTLFGLADSLTGLPLALEANEASEISIENNQESASNETSTENSKGMIQALGDLLDKMKGALAPSIFGILFTILGVILYGAYLQFACHSVKSILERSTLTVWVPQLYPTTSQKLVQTLQQSESQMRKGFETAAQFSESVEKINDNIDEFNENLTQTSDLTEPLSNSVVLINKAASDISTAADTLNTGFTNNLDKFSKEFTSSVTHLTGFQDEIRNLHEQFQEAANQKLNQFQEEANEKLDQQIETLNKQDQNLTTTVEVLKNCENLYVESCQQIDNTLQEFLNKTTEANANIEETNRAFLEGINTNNREWISVIQGQLKTELAIIQPTLEKELKTLTEQLTTDLQEVQSTLDARLKGLTDQLNFFQLPIERTADQIEGTIGNFTSTVERIVNNVQTEFQNQSETLKQQNENYEEQLIGVKRLNESVENLLTQLNESSTNQKNAVDVLNTNVGGLTEDINNLDNGIKSLTSDSGELSQSVQVIIEIIGKLGEASQEFVEKVDNADVTPLTASIDKLNTSINDISQHSETFADSVESLATQVKSTESEVKPKKKIISKLRSKFSRKKTSKLNDFDSQSQNE